MLAHCCSSRPSQDALVQAGATPALISLLDNSAQRTRQAAALSALAALTRNNPVSCAAVLKNPIDGGGSGDGAAAAGDQVLSQLLSYAKTSTLPRTRFTACECLIHLSPYIPEAPGASAAPEQEDLDLEAGGVDATAAPLLQNYSGNISQETVDTAVLPVIVRLLSENEVWEDVPTALIVLAQEKPSLQSAAVDADAIVRLATLVRDPAIGVKGRGSALLALGMLTEKVESHRRQLVDSGVLPVIASALTDASSAVRAAACNCMRSLSRSTRLLRCSLGSLGDVAAPLLELSRSDDVEVATEAAATLANMAVEYSSLKEQVLVLQGIARFVELTGAMNKRMRLYGVWGLSSVVYLASPEVKAAVMNGLPWSCVRALLQDEDQEVKVKSICS